MKKILKLLFAVVFMAAISAPAQAELMITPMTVIVKDNERFALVTLVNSSRELKTYEMGLNFTKMREEGAMYDMVDKPVTDFDLSKHISFTPRRISLAPGASQKIRLAIRRPAEAIPPGDYRVHLVFSSVPADGKLSKDGGSEPIPSTPQTAQNGEAKVKAGVRLYVGFSIPVILRVGKPDVSAQIGDMTLSKTDSGQMQVNLPILRQGGSYSILGELRLYQTGADGKQEEIGSIGNANIFPEINRRVFRIVLTKPLKSGATVKAVYKDTPKQGDTVYAEKSFPIQ